MDSGLRLEEVEGEAVFDVAEPWNSLASQQGSFFNSESWARNWWLHLADRANLRSAVVWDRVNVVGLAALVEQPLPLHSKFPLRPRAWISLGSLWGAGDHLGPLVASGSGAAGHLISWLTADSGATVVLPAIDTATQIGRALATEFAEFGVESCPQAVIPGAATFDDVTSTWSRNRRKKIGQLKRRFDSEGGRSRLFFDKENLLRLLPVVRSLHRRRMTQVGRRTAFGWNPRYAAFHQALCSEAQGDSGPWIQVCELGGRPISALYGFRIGDTYHVYQSGWDPTMSQHSPGLLQYALAFERVVDAGGRVFDMCRGMDDYKLRFATGIRKESVLATPRGLSGVALELGWRGRRYVKDR